MVWSDGVDSLQKKNACITLGLMMVVKLASILFQNGTRGNERDHVMNDSLIFIKKPQKLLSVHSRSNSKVI